MLLKKAQLLIVRQHEMELQKGQGLLGEEPLYFTFDSLPQPLIPVSYPESSVLKARLLVLNLFTGNIVLFPVVNPPFSNLITTT